MINRFSLPTGWPFLSFDPIILQRILYSFAKLFCCTLELYISQGEVPGCPSPIALNFGCVLEYRGVGGACLFILARLGGKTTPHSYPLITVTDDKNIVHTTSLNKYDLWGVVSPPKYENEPL